MSDYKQMEASAKAHVYSQICELSRCESQFVDSRAKYIGTLLSDLSQWTDVSELERMFINMLNTVRP